MDHLEGKWKFNWRNSDIWYDGDYYDTKEEAIRAAQSYENRPSYEGELYNSNKFSVGQVANCKNNIHIDAKYVLEWISDSVYDEFGEVAEDYLMHIKDEHEEILEKRLNSVVKEWMKEFGYEPDFYKIVNVEEVKVRN